MPMYNLIDYSDSCSKTSRNLWQYYKDNANNNSLNSKSFNFKLKITGKTYVAGNKKDVKIAVLLKHLSNFCRNLEMPLINCKINLILNWLENCLIFSATGATKFKITDTKLYVFLVTLSTQDNAKLLQQLKSGFKRATNWNKYQWKVSSEKQNQYLDFLIDPSFQGVKSRTRWRCNNTIFFIIEKARETILDFSQGTVKVLWFFYFNIISV